MKSLWDLQENDLNENVEVRDGKGNTVSGRLWSLHEERNVVINPKGVGVVKTISRYVWIDNHRYDADRVSRLRLEDLK